MYEGHNFGKAVIVIILFIGILSFGTVDMEPSGMVVFSEDSQGELSDEDRISNIMDTETCEQMKQIYEDEQGSISSILHYEAASRLCDGDNPWAVQKEECCWTVGIR